MKTRESRAPLPTLGFYRTAQVGNFKLWGAMDADGDAHLEHLRYIGEFLDDMPLATVPEPSAATLVLVGAAAISLRRRRIAA